jgi:hypothetical protein
MRVELADGGLDIMSDDRRAEVLLARKIIVERALGDADFRHELLQPGPMVALLHHQEDASLQEFLADMMSRRLMLKSDARLNMQVRSTT